jgi:integrase
MDLCGHLREVRGIEAISSHDEAWFSVSSPVRSAISHAGCSPVASSAGQFGVCEHPFDGLAIRFRFNPRSVRRIENRHGHRALRRLMREYPDAPQVFVSERGGPMTASNVRKMLTRAGEGLGISVHPHMLRHGCGFKLANQGIDTRSIQAFMGHSSIASTVVYTEIAPQRFKGFWKD